MRSANPVLVGMGCEVNALHLDFQVHRGTMFMPHNHCCDMDACIGLFRIIDPDVIRIETYAGSKQDTVYVLEGLRWIAYAPHEKATDQVHSK